MPRFLMKALPSFDNLVKYQYKPLEQGHTSRLIEIQPGPADDALRVSIVTTSFDVDYEALSWYWGAEDETAPVIVAEFWGKRILKHQSVLYVKPTLKAAMVSLRLRRQVRRTWIDAVCINQQDDVEKSIQVGNMANIYRLARSVCVWLPVQNAAQTAKMVKDIRTSEALRKIMLHGGAGRADIIGLLSSPWFGRRWIVQEISLAPRAAMLLSGYEVKWDDFSRFVCLVHEYYEVTHDRPTSDLDMSVETHTSAFYHSTAHRLVELVSKLRVPADPTRFLATHLLEDVLCLCNRFRCQRGHDTVYALLPLGSDVLSRGQARGDSDGISTISNFTVDYTKTALKVYQDFIQFAVRSARGRTDVILRHWALQDIDNPGLAQVSWLQPPPPTGRDGDHRPVQQRELTGTAERPLFCAAGPVVSELTLQNEMLFRGDGRLCIDTILLDTIASTLRTVNVDVISRSWPIYFGWLDTATQAPPDHFWQTLVAGLDQTNQPVRLSGDSSQTCTDTNLRSACHDAFRGGANFRLYSLVSDVVLFELKRVFWSGGNLDDIACSESLTELRQHWRRFNFDMRHPDQQLRVVQVLRRTATDGYLSLPFLDTVQTITPARYQLSPTALHFLRAEVLEVIDLEAMLEAARYRKLVHASTVGRSLFKSSEMALVGLVPNAAVAGDLICIIRGCSVPVVLRILPPAGEGGVDCYAIVGEAFVYGMMDGQALALNKVWKRVEIC